MTRISRKERREREKNVEKKGRDTLMYTRDVWARLDKAAECSMARFIFFLVPIFAVSSLFCIPLSRWHARHSGRVIGMDRYNGQSHGCLVINSANWLHEKWQEFSPSSATNDLNLAEWILWFQILEEIVAFLHIADDRSQRAR